MAQSNPPEEMDVGEKSKARPYQTELLVQAINSNSIVYLGTGSGKTFIAVMMIKEYMADLLSGEKKTVFLVNSVPLAAQQRDYLARHLGQSITVKSFCGEDGVDDWKKKHWDQVIPETQVLVMIHQVFLDALNASYLSMSMVNLIIIDECHHAVKNSPYVQIFKGHYHPLKERSPHEAPRVLGLSASIVTSKCNIYKFRSKMEELEKILDSKVITTNDLNNYLKYVTEPEEKVVAYPDQDEDISINSIVERAIDDLSRISAEEKRRYERYDKVTKNKQQEVIENKFKDYSSVLEKIRKCIHALGYFVGNAVVDESMDLTVKELYVTSDPFIIHLCKIIKKALQSLRRHLSTKLPKTEDLTRLEEFSSPKVRKLLDILRSRAQPTNLTDAYEGQTNRNLTAIIFVTEQQTSTSLAHLIKKANIPGIRVGHVVGGSFSRIKNPSASLLTKKGEPRAKTSQTINDFRLGKLNVIVSTAVLEEGMDVQQCNLVIRFDPIQQFRSYVQSKGRARAKPSQYIIMVEANKMQDWMSDWERYRDIEKMSIDECHPEGVDDDCTKDEGIYPYYRFPLTKEGPRITQYQAVSIVYRYVQSLPCDRFTTLAPYFEFQDAANLPVTGRTRLLLGLGIDERVGYQCTLYLPHGSICRDPIKSSVQPTRNAAKRCVALIACRLLHSNEILDENLKFRKKCRMDFEDDEDLGDPRKPKPGTKRSRSYYKIKLPKELQIHSLNQGLLYKINLELVEESLFAKHKKQYNIYRPETVGRKLGILVGMKLPEAALEPFYLDTLSGKVMVQLEMVDEMKKIDATLLNQILEFQTKIIPDVLQSTLSWTELDTTSSDYLILPVDERGNVDQQLLEKIFRKPENKDPNEIFVFKAENFQDAVILPTHKETSERFFVEECVHDRSPESKMPNDDSMTFQSFYKIHHDKIIRQMKQPLLRISNANKHHFMFAPVSQTDDQGNVYSTSPKSRKEFLKERTLFVPELVNIHAVPGSLWREIQMLPFVMHRVVSKMKTSDLRSTIQAETSFIEDKTKKQFEWKKASASEVFLQLISQKSPLSQRLPSIDDLTEGLTLTGAGEKVNLERLESLGDSFLKFSVSVALFLNLSLQKATEGMLTQIRSRMVGNRKLSGLMCSKDFPGLLHAQKFEPHLQWLAPRLKQKDNLEEMLCKLDKEFRERFMDESDDENPTPAKKMKLPNATLFKLLTKADVEEYLAGGKTETQLIENARSRLLDPLKGDRLSPRESVLISDKSLADAAEALIGVFLIRLGQGPALEFMSWLGLEISPDLSKTDLLKGTQPESFSPSSSWFVSSSTSFPSNAISDPESDLPQVMFDIFLAKIDMKSIEDQLGYGFKEKTFLVQALTHASYTPNMFTDSYERLEFLGDSVLDYLVTSHLYTRFDDLKPGEITDLRSALVNNNTLASICVKNNFYRHLMHQNNNLMKKIDDYINYCESNLEDVDSVNVKKDPFIENLELHNEGDYPVLEDVEVPKVLGDIVEALIGAVYLDTKGDLVTVWRVITKIFPDIDEVIKKKPQNFVKIVYEMFPQTISFKKVGTVAGGKVEVIATITPLGGDPKTSGRKFRGIGNNKTLAKVAAARCVIRETKRFNR